METGAHRRIERVHGPSEGVLIGVVGKPSVGKSSFLNAATDANAKVGSYPFTTIEPNRAVGYYQCKCKCTDHHKQDLCLPRYGTCCNGMRRVPVNLLDVAGLVPGASEGKGKGNAFLDDLRTATVLLHIIDASGTVNEKGESCEDYDPSVDVAWFFDELSNWIFNNLWRKWPALVRKHLHAKTTAVHALLAQLSGYGTRPHHIQRTLELVGNADLATWDEVGVRRLVEMFLKVRFPIILVLNKADSPKADQHMSKLCSLYPDSPMIPCSAVAERFLRKLHEDQYIHYVSGEEQFITAEEDRERRYQLKPLDDRTRRRLDNIRDLVLFRYGSTGVQNAIQRAVETLHMLPVYVVKNIHNFTDGVSPNAFRDVMLVPEGTTVREVAYMCGGRDMGDGFEYAEGPDGRRLGEDEICLPGVSDILKFTWTAPMREQTSASSGGSERESPAESTN